MEHAKYLDAIKRVLKLREVTYVELAQHLKMSESGVKKMLNAKDISFRRILQICEAIDILPGQLFSLSEKTAISEVTLTRDQEEALLRNRVLLAVYWRLAIEKYDLGEIEKLQGLSKSELKKVLDKLVALDLLSVKKNVYRAKHHGKFRWIDDSKLARTLNSEWSELTLKRSLQNKNGAFHRLVAMKLSESSYRELTQQLSKILDETIQQSEKEEMSLPRRQLHNITTLIATVPKGVFDS